jgi:hypothetical protein
LEKSQVSAAAVTVWEKRKKLYMFAWKINYSSFACHPHTHSPALGLHFKAPRTSSFYDVVAIGEK